MNQGENTQTVAPLDAKSVENRYCIDATQMQTSSYHYSTTGSDTASWATHRVDSHTADDGNYSNASYHYAQPTEPTSKSIQDGSNPASFPSSSTSGTTNVAQDYGGYASYATSTDPYGYGSTGYTGYYNGYQQQPNQSHSQAAGAYQNTGAPYQPLSSFQNTGSYAGSASYSGTYYNHANYQTSGGYSSNSYTNQTPEGYTGTSFSGQTSGGYPSTPYNNQTTLWNQGNYTNYASNAYPTYTPDTNVAHSSSTATKTSQHYQQHCKQYADYYSQTEVTCAPGTENLSVLGTSNQTYASPGVSSGIATSNSQPAQPYFQSWRPDVSSSQTPSLQPGPAVSSAHGSYWTNSMPNYQNHHPAPIQAHYQSSLNPKPLYDTFQDQQKATFPQGLNSQSSTHQVPPIYQLPVQTAPSFDTRRVTKLQIPTNPRIASILPLGFPKTGKDSSTASAVTKPAYVSISLSKPNDNADDSMLKSGAFPKSLRSYVERALSRCKDDKEKACCQAALKEIITKATADGTLYTRDWDTEPLLPVLNPDMINQESQISAFISSLSKRSPIRRSKSRWEPLLEEKEIVKSPSVGGNTVKFRGWSHLNEKDKKKVETFGNYKSRVLEQSSANKNIPRPVKRQRFAVGVNAAVDGEASSDSDKEESLAPSYSSTISLADSADEKKRRENRSKRFEKGQGHRRENNFIKPKTASAGNLYSRRATALMLSKNFDDDGTRAVEDIDWDALTVKGTCQEIEKRYLRLTSAPDPSTVRPEDVLEKALLMVQNSQKNYLYKCDQLKSIRQDLTVQRIHNRLTVKVYEAHARFALEAGDLPEYNQCLSQLKILYAEGIEGCHLEFAAYNLLYVILHSNNNRELLSSMSRLSNDAKKDEAVKHALLVRAAVTAGNYVKFFRLYKAAPNLNTYLMDLYVEKMRYRAVSCMSRAYRPTISVSYIAQVLGFVGASSEGDDEKEADGLEDCMEWLKAHGASLVGDNYGEMLLDAKASASSLYMPEPEDAVAHGDPNLAVNDFFTKTLS